MSGTNSFRILSLFLAIAGCRAADSGAAEASAARALLRHDDIAGAQKIIEKALAVSPNSAELLETRGELRFRQGDIPAADADYRKAIELDGRLARAFWGLARVYRAASLYKKAQLYFWQAHTWDPLDWDIFHSWIDVLKRPQRIAELQKFVDAPPAEARVSEIQHARERLEWEQGLGDTKLHRLTSAYSATQIPFAPLLWDPNHVRAFAVPVSINGSKPLKLEIDTGAGGILINSKAAEKLGLRKLREIKVGGIGDEGERAAYAGMADTVRIGSVAFASTIVRVSDKKGFPDIDGLIGMDVFSDFLVTLDFPKRVLRLTPLPNYADDGEPHDRAISPELKGFTGVYRLGHSLLIPTRVSDSAPVLFIIDTGAGRTLIASDLARQATKVHRDDAHGSMKGLSGKVKEMYVTDALVLQFAGFRQNNLDMSSFDFSKLSRAHGIEVSGFLGLPLLNLFELTIDYRDGLVKFVYSGQRHAD
jgi:predicted aspartyl protease